MERVVLKKYCPPDFDPCRLKREKDGGELKPVVIPTLVNLTSQWIRDHLHLSSVSNIVSQVPDELLELLLDGCTPDQLAKIEFHAQRDLSQVTEDIWRTHCRTFLNNKDLDDKNDCSSWKEYYQQLMMQYEQKKAQTGKHLRSLYDERAKEKASKKIKVLDSAPVAKGRSSFGTTFTGYSKTVSKPMERCLKDARKNQVAMAWRKPQPLKPVITIIPKQATLAPKYSNFKPSTLAPKITNSPSKVLITPKLSSPSPAKSNHPIATTFKPTNTNISRTNISKPNSLASHLPSHSTKPSLLPPTSEKFSTKPSLSQKLSSSLPSSKSHMQNPHPKFSPTRI